MPNDWIVPSEHNRLTWTDDGELPWTIDNSTASHGNFSVRYGAVGKRPVVAWNGTREAARAAFDAIPLMSAAEVVRVLSIDPHRGGAKTGLAPVADLAASLARHGLTVEPNVTHSGDIGTADALLSYLADVGADLLVMGGFGAPALVRAIGRDETTGLIDGTAFALLLAH